MTMYGFKNNKTNNSRKNYVKFDDLLSNLSDAQENALLVKLLEKRGITMKMEDEDIVFSQSFTEDKRDASQLFLKAGYLMLCEYLEEKDEYRRSSQKSTRSVEVLTENY